MKTFTLFALFLSSIMIHPSVIAWSINKNDDGSCFIESDFVDIKDGYQRTQVKLRVTINEIMVISKAPLDQSFNDLGLQVEAGSVELESSLQKTRGVLLKYKHFSSGDLQKATLGKENYEKEIARIISHEWYKDYQKNPVNAERFDKQMITLEAELAESVQTVTSISKYLEAKKEEKKLLGKYKQVEKYDFVLTDGVVDVKNASFRKNYNKLMSLLKKGERVRLQLRFWPTWPKTNHHDTYINLSDFNKKQEICLLAATNNDVKK